MHLSTWCNIPVDLNLHSTAVRISNFARFCVLRQKKYHSWIMEIRLDRHKFCQFFLMGHTNNLPVLCIICHLGIKQIQMASNSNICFSSNQAYSFISWNLPIVNTLSWTQIAGTNASFLFLTAVNFLNFVAVYSNLKEFILQHTVSSYPWVVWRMD